MTTCVLDACALIALLRNEPGGAEVRSLTCFRVAASECAFYQVGAES
jgi:PIN domain nuclease of toxin-antitoxin system